MEKFTDKQHVNSSGERILVRPRVSITVLSINATTELVVGHVLSTSNNTASQLTSLLVSNVHRASEITVSKTSVAIILPEKLLRDKIAGKCVSFLAFIIQ